MANLPEIEIDVEALKARIRATVAEREATGQPSFITASRELYNVLSPNGSATNSSSLADLLIADIKTRWSQQQPRFDLQPHFQPRTDDHYDINELLQFHDHHFIWNAYRAILKREPDEAGYQGYLELLRSGRRNKIDILASLRSSPEGERAHVAIEGLGRARFRRFYRIPVLGYLAELAVSLLRLPALIRSQRQLENHFSAQQDRIASYVDERISSQVSELKRLDQNSARFAESLTRLYERQTDIASLQQQQLAALLRNQSATNTATGKQAQVPDELYAALARHLRGDSETTKNDLKPYLALVKEAGINSRVVDLGCGRGEWLELLKENGIEATGVEANSVLSNEARKKRLTVVSAAAIEYLRGLSEGSLNLVTGFHLLEHLEFAQLVELLKEIKRTLKPGGLVILETPNPKNLVVGACNFYSDPTHRQPLFPETVQFLLSHCGFTGIRIEYLHPAGGSPFTNDQAGAKELDTWLFGPRDFAAIAAKS